MKIRNRLPHHSAQCLSFTAPKLGPNPEALGLLRAVLVCLQHERDQHLAPPCYVSWDWKLLGSNQLCVLLFSKSVLKLRDCLFCYSPAGTEEAWLPLLHQGKSFAWSFPLGGGTWTMCHLNSSWLHWVWHRSTWYVMMLFRKLQQPSPFSVKIPHTEWSSEHFSLLWCKWAAVSTHHFRSSFNQIWNESVKQRPYTTEGFLVAD